MTQAELTTWARFHRRHSSIARQIEAERYLSWIETGRPEELRMAEVAMDQANWFRPPGVPERKS